MKIKLGELIESIGDGIHGTPEYDINGEYYFINGNNLYQGQIVVNDETLKVSEKEYNRIKRNIGKNTLLLSINGTLGNVAKYNNEKVALGKSVCYINVKDSTLIDYVYFVMNSLEFKKYMNMVSHGSTIKNFAPSQVLDFEFDTTSLENQKFIGNIYSKLIALINNYENINNKMDVILRQIYNYSFFQYNDEKLKYDENLNYNIPANWSCLKLKDCLQSINTGLNPRNHFKFSNTEKIKYITVKNLTSDGLMLLDTYDRINKESKKIIHNRSKIAPGDVLYASIAPLGRCYLIVDEPEDWDINESVFSIRVNEEIITPEYLYMVLTSDYFIKKAEHNSSGSIFNGIRISVLENMYILVPSKDKIALFTKKTKSIFKYKNSNSNKINKIRELIKFLTPLLMNNNIKIED